MTLSRAFFMVVLFSGLSSPGVVDAKEGSEWRLSAQLATRINPIGLQFKPAIALRRGLFTSDSVLLDKAYVEMGLVGPMTPVSGFNHVYVEVVPIAPIRLQASAKRLQYFGNLGLLAELEDGSTNWSPETRKSFEDDGRGTSTRGTDAALLANLRLKVGRVLGSFTYDHHWISVQIPNSSNWYDPFFDLMFAQSDQVSILTGFVGYIASGDLDSDRFTLFAGKYESFTTERSGVTRQLASALAVWRPGWMAEDRLTLGAVLGYYLEDAYLEGQPMGAVFAAVSWDGALAE